MTTYIDSALEAYAKLTQATSPTTEIPESNYQPPKRGGAVTYFRLDDELGLVQLSRKPNGPLVVVGDSSVLQRAWAYLSSWRERAHLLGRLSGFDERDPSHMAALKDFVALDTLPYSSDPELKAKVEKIPHHQIWIQQIGENRISAEDTFYRDRGITRVPLAYRLDLERGLLGWRQSYRGLIDSFDNFLDAGINHLQDPHLRSALVLATKIEPTAPHPRNLGELLQGNEKVLFLAKEADSQRLSGLVKASTSLRADLATVTRNDGAVARLLRSSQNGQKTLVELCKAMKTLFPLDTNPRPGGNMKGLMALIGIAGGLYYLWTSHKNSNTEDSGISVAKNFIMHGVLGYISPLAEAGLTAAEMTGFA